MPTCAAETYVRSTPDRAFAVFTDLEAVGDRLSAIEEIELLTDGPIRVGTRWKETRELMGQSATEEMEIVEFDAPRRLVAQAESYGTRYTTQFEFEPEGAGTRIRVTFRAEPQSWTARAMSTVLGGTMMGSVQEMLAQDLADLKAWIESS
jgi:carbon monoxide dehydrogenase subunit G